MFPPETPYFGVDPRVKRTYLLVLAGLPERLPFAPALVAAVREYAPAAHLIVGVPGPADRTIYRAWLDLAHSTRAPRIHVHILDDRALWRLPPATEEWYRTARRAQHRLLVRHAGPHPAPAALNDDDWIPTQALFQSLHRRSSHPIIRTTLWRAWGAPNTTNQNLLLHCSPYWWWHDPIFEGAFPTDATVHAPAHLLENELEAPIVKSGALDVGYLRAEDRYRALQRYRSAGKLDPAVYPLIDPPVTLTLLDEAFPPHLRHAEQLLRRFTYISLEDGKDGKDGYYEGQDA